MLHQVCGSRAESRGIVAEPADPTVAAIAENPAHAASLVAMVNSPGADAARLGDGTYRASAALRRKHGVEVVECEAKFLPESTDPAVLTHPLRVAILELASALGRAGLAVRLSAVCRE